MNGAPESLADAEVEILEDLVKHARKLSLTKDPRKRIVVSRWEIFFSEQLANAKSAEQLQLRLSNALADDDEDERAQLVAED